MTIEFDAPIEEKKPTRKAKAVKEQVESSTNLKEFAQLKEELRRGRMPERKKVALLTRLTTLFDGNKLDENELAFFREIITRERTAGRISKYHEVILNNMEVVECVDKCYVKTPDAPRVLHLSNGLVCDYMFDGEKSRYIVFVPIRVPAEHQLDMKTAMKIANGHHVDDKDLPKEKIMYRRLNLKPVEFEKWFGYDDDALIGNKPKEDIEYQF